MTDQNSFGYGQQTPVDSTSDVNQLMFAIEQMLGFVRTTVLVQIKAVTNDGGISPVGFVDAQPLVNMLDGNGYATQHGTVLNLPYFRLQGGANAVIIDPVVGDIGIAVICDRDISSVKASKAIANPGSYRRFALADGIYLGGVLNGTPEQYVVFTDTGIKIADKNGNVLEFSAAGITATPVGGVFKVNGAIHATDNVIAGFGGADQVGLQTHEHPTAVNGPPSPPTPGT